RHRPSARRRAGRPARAPEPGAGRGRGGRAGGPARPLNLPGEQDMTQPHYTAVVTGGSTGIGEDICRKMLDAGYTVISMARNALPWTHERLHCVQVDLLDAA